MAATYDGSIYDGTSYDGDPAPPPPPAPVSVPAITLNGFGFDGATYDGGLGPQSWPVAATARLILAAATGREFRVSAAVTVVLAPRGSLSPRSRAVAALVLLPAAAATRRVRAAASVVLRLGPAAGESTRPFAGAPLVVSATATAGAIRGATAAVSLAFRGSAFSGPAYSEPAAATVVLTGRADATVLLAGDPNAIRTVYRTGVSGRYPFWFDETPGMVVLISNGVDPMLRWDGIDRSIEVAGVPAPTTAPIILTDIFPTAAQQIDTTISVGSDGVLISNTPLGVHDNNNTWITPLTPTGDEVSVYGVPADTATYFDAVLGQVATYPLFTPAIRLFFSSLLQAWTTSVPRSIAGSSYVAPFVTAADGTVTEWVTHTPNQVDQYSIVGTSLDEDVFLGTGFLAGGLDTPAGLINGGWVRRLGAIAAQVVQPDGSLGPPSPFAQQYVGWYEFGGRLYPPTTAPVTVNAEITIPGAPPGPASQSPTQVVPAPGSIYAFVRFLDRHGNVSDFSPISGGVAPLANYVYADVPVPSGPHASKVARRQVLRNTVGQAATWYVDVDTADLVSTTFVSTLTDDQLKANEAVPLFDDTGALVANTHGFPPSHKAVTVMHLGRCFAAGEVTYADGSVEVAAGSDRVRGVGTAWPASFVGRDLWVSGAQRAHPIAAVDVEGQVLTLGAGYDGPTDRFAAYAIRPSPFERRLVYYTPAGLPESWPAFYALSVQDDGDEITGLMQLSSFLYVVERRHVYRFTFKDDPATDGALFLSSRRGALNARLWVQAEDVAYMLDELGVHAFSGGVSEPISEPVQDLFRDNSASPLRIDWDADSTLWSASYSEVHGTIRFFVAMTGARHPRHALCYNYRQQRWWIEEYMRPVCSCCRTRIGVIRTLAGFDHREVAALDVGYTDGARAVLGTVRGTVTAASRCSLSDSAATFAADATNLAVFLTSGAGRWQWRRVVAVTPTRLETLTPWLVAPRPGDAYAVAGISWSWRGGWFRFVDPTEPNRRRDVETLYQPISAGTMDLQLYYNRQDEPRSWSVSRDGAATVEAGSSAVVVDLTNPRGRALMRLEGHAEAFVQADQYVSVELLGVQCGEPIEVYRVTMNGVEADG